jgi:hypothetical protein
VDCDTNSAEAWWYRVLVHVQREERDGSDWNRLNSVAVSRMVESWLSVAYFTSLNWSLRSFHGYDDCICVFILISVLSTVLDSASVDFDTIPPSSTPLDSSPCASEKNLQVD